RVVLMARPPPPVAVSSWHGRRTVRSFSILPFSFLPITAPLGSPVCSHLGHPPRPPAAHEVQFVVPQHAGSLGVLGLASLGLASLGLAHKFTSFGFGGSRSKSKPLRLHCRAATSVGRWVIDFASVPWGPAQIAENGYAPAPRAGDRARRTYGADVTPLIVVGQPRRSTNTSSMMLILRSITMRTFAGWPSSASSVSACHRLTSARVPTSA